MVNQSLKNKKIIISAGASGIGLATAKVSISRGAYVYLCDINNISLNKLNKHPLINKRLFKYNCDASDESQVLDLFKKISKKTKKIDALINNKFKVNNYNLFLSISDERDYSIAFTILQKI